MGNRLSPGCCCGCDLIDATFDTTVETSWVKAFNHYNASDVLQSHSVGDALGTFTAGEYLVSKKTLPSANWAIDLTGLVANELFATPWFQVSGNVLIVEFIDASDDSQVVEFRIYSERSALPEYTTSGTDFYRHMLRADVTIDAGYGTSVDVDLKRFFSSATDLSPIGTGGGIAITVRDTVIEVAPTYAGGGSIHYNDEDADYTGRLPIPIATQLPTTRLKLSIEGDDATLLAVFAGKVAHPDDSLNITCPEKATCEIVPPYHHQEWEVGSISTPNSASLYELLRTYTNCCAALDEASPDYSVFNRQLIFDQDVLHKTRRCFYTSPTATEFPGPLLFDTIDTDLADATDEIVSVTVCVEDDDEYEDGSYYKISIEATIGTIRPAIEYDAMTSTGTVDDHVDDIEVSGSFASFDYPSTTVTSHPLYSTPDACPATGSGGGTLTAPGDDKSSLRQDSFFLTVTASNDPLVLNWVVYRTKWIGNNMPDITVTGAGSTQGLASDDLTRVVFVSAERTETLPFPPGAADFGYGTYFISGGYFQKWRINTKAKTVDYADLSITITGPA